VFASYLIFYSFGRIFIESIRIDPSYVFAGLRTNVWSAIFGVIAGVVLFYLQSRRHTGLEETVYLPNREPAVVESESDETEELIAEAK
jgi:prolipoprotein diacylglyceryltransferase